MSKIFLSTIFIVVDFLLVVAVVGVLLVELRRLFGRRGLLGRTT